MKKCTFLLIAALLTAATAVFADDKKPMTVTELPAAAQQFIKTNFPNHTVSHVKLDGNLMNPEYKVMFSDGCEVEFTKNGQWEEISVKEGAVPAGVVPQQVRDYMTKNHPDRMIRSIERHQKTTELKLDNGMEMTFNAAYKLVKTDD